MKCSWSSKPEGAEYWVPSTIPGYAGYWVKYSPKTRTWFGWSGGDTWVATMPPDILWKACTPADALIESAAKELLAALDDVLHGTSRDREDAADRAISKARGES